MEISRPHRLIILTLIFLLALALRLYWLDAQSLWNDEGTSVALAGRDLITITRNAAHDIHPPLYYYLLHFWTILLGASEFAVRSLSAMTGTLLVALTFLLGRRLFSAEVGLVAALLSAVSPFQVYYSQETRMYILAALLGALSMYFGLRIADCGLRGANCGLRNTRDEGRAQSLAAIASRITHYASRITHYVLRPPLPAAGSPFLISHFSFLIPYVVVTVAALYTHYFAFSLVLAENLIAVVWLVTGHRRGGLGRFIRQWIVAQGAIGLLYLPWLVYTWGQLRQWPAVSEPFSPSFLLRDVFRIFSLGLPGQDTTLVSLMPFGLMLLLGCVSPLLQSWRLETTPTAVGNRWAKSPYGDSIQSAKADFAVCSRDFQSPGQALVTLSYLLVPLAAMYLLSLRRPLYNPKFLLLATPPFYLLLARGVLLPREVETRFLRRNLVSILSVGLLISGLLLLALLIPSARSLHATYADPRYHRDDYRGIVRTITAAADENDAVLINAPGQFETFVYYYHGDTSMRLSAGLDVYPLPRQRPIDVAATRQDLEAIAAEHDRIFAVLWATDESDPDRFVEGWLDEHAFKARDTWYGNVRLVIYAVPTTGTPVDVQHPLQANLGDQVVLLGYSLSSEEVVAGEALPLTLVWQAQVQMTERYKVFVQLLDGHNHIVGQRDAEPGGGAKITTLWEPGEVVTDNYGVLVAPGTPPGEHRLIVGMYSLANGARLPVLDGGEIVGDHVELAMVQVTRPSTPPSPDALGMMHQLDADFGEVTLLGYDVSKLGSEHQPDVPLHPGDPLHVTLYWKATARPTRDISLSLLLLGRDDRVWVHRQTGPVDGSYPVTLWEPGEVVRDQHLLFLPPDLPLGRYHVRLEARAVDGSMMDGSHDLGPVTVQ